VLVAQDECLDCHDAPAQSGFSASVHGEILGCIDCHEGAGDEAHMDGLAPVECALCHDDAVEELGGGMHRRVFEEVVPEPRGCAACHGEPHGILAGSDEASPTHHANLATTCSRCHADPETAQLLGFSRVRPLEAYQESVHGRAVRDNNGGPSCTDCHGAHQVLPAGDPASPVHFRQVASTCGACHGEVEEAFSASVHGRAVARGERDVPTCTDCHGEHRILSPNEPGSPVFASNVPKLTCGRCHGDLRLAEKYDLPSNSVSAYQDSYHGLAMRAGSATVAHCGSCHGIHDILPSSDSASHIHPANLPTTCGQCHPGAGTSFAIGSVHVLPTEKEHAVVYWLRQLYLWMIFVTVGGMVIHNGLDLIQKARRPEVWRNVEPPEHPTERLSAGFRTAHGMLAVSFLVLVYTGFALKYPETWWAAPLVAWESKIGLRGLLHRSAAVAMIAAAVLHAVHLVMSREARQCIREMRPKRADLTELRERVRWLVGRTAHPPLAPRVGYIEKVEYLAVIWGTLVMAATGFALWMETLVLRWLPSWVLDVATVIHFYEAVLASLAILVWHFYSVIFDPAVYPMDPAWLTGHSAPGRAAERDES